MRIKYKLVNLRITYIFFWFLTLLNIFLPTVNVYAKTFSVNNVEISNSFEINFNKSDIIEEGFRVAFNRLIISLIKSEDQKTITKTEIGQIKSMIETFSIKEEKFINGIYYLNLSVEFDKKKIFNLLRDKNINSSLFIKKKIFFMPIIIDDNNEIFIFNKSILFKKWNINREEYELLEYILPEEDIENLSIIQTKINNIENYNFDEIIKKYNVEDFIIALIYINSENTTVLSKINFNGTLELNTQSFQNIDLHYNDNVDQFINNLKIIYEDSWKIKNQINTFTQLELTISINNKDNKKISNFEETLANLDLVYDYYISKIDNKNIIYKIFFNGASDNFLKIMKNNNYEFYIQNQFWLLK